MTRLIYLGENETPYSLEQIFEQQRVLWDPFQQDAQPGEINIQKTVCSMYCLTDKVQHNINDF